MKINWHTEGCPNCGIPLECSQCKELIDDFTYMLRELRRVSNIMLSEYGMSIVDQRIFQKYEPASQDGAIGNVARSNCLPFSCTHKGNSISQHPDDAAHVPNNQQINISDDVSELVKKCEEQAQLRLELLAVVQKLRAENESLKIELGKWREWHQRISYLENENAMLRAQNERRAIRKIVWNLNDA